MDGWLGRNTLSLCVIALKVKVKVSRVYSQAAMDGFCSPDFTITSLVGILTHSLRYLNSIHMDHNGHSKDHELFWLYDYKKLIIIDRNASRTRIMSALCTFSSSSSSFHSWTSVRSPSPPCQAPHRRENCGQPEYPYQWLHGALKIYTMSL